MHLFLQNVGTCAILDASTSPCSTLAVVSSSFRVYWGRPLSVGYDTYFPNPAYGIDYYRVEVSGDPLDFQTLAGSVTCVIAQNNPACHFDRRVALVTGLTGDRVYYYRVIAVTIVGDGQYSTTLTSPTIRAPANCLCTGYTVGVCTACVSASQPASTDVSACVCGPGRYYASTAP
jgi:hypothetical protein